MGWNGEQMDIFNMNTFDQNDTTPIENEKPVDNDIPLSSSTKAVAYVDGSFNSVTKIFGYGVVLFHNGKEIKYMTEAMIQALPQCEMLPVKYMVPWQQ